MNELGLNFLELGDSDKLPIILIHGMALDQTMWTPQIPVLKEHYRVMTYDIRGHGLSNVGDGQYTYQLKIFQNSKGRFKQYRSVHPGLPQKIHWSGIEFFKCLFLQLSKLIQ